MAIVQLLRRARALPKTIAKAFHQRRRNAHLKEREAERLDRIRNPSKYLGN